MKTSEQMNEFSCALACISNILGEPYTQKYLFEALKDQFPIWKTKPGALTVGDMFNLFERLDVNFTKILRSSVWSEIENLDAVGFSSSILALHRKPTRHCWRVLECGAAHQTGEKMLRVMIPDQGGAKIDWISEKELRTKHDVEYIAIVYPTIADKTKDQPNQTPQTTPGS